MARKPNYNFEKLRKERDRKAKKDAKREARLGRKEQGAPQDSAPVNPALPENHPPTRPR